MSTIIDLNPFLIFHMWVFNHKETVHTTQTIIKDSISVFALTKSKQKKYVLGDVGDVTNDLTFRLRTSDGQSDDSAIMLGDHFSCLKCKVYPSDH